MIRLSFSHMTDRLAERSVKSASCRFGFNSLFLWAWFKSHPFIPAPFSYLHPGEETALIVITDWLIANLFKSVTFAAPARGIVGKMNNKTTFKQHGSMFQHRASKFQVKHYEATCSSKKNALLLDHAKMHLQSRDSTISRNMERGEREPLQKRGKEK